jgi:hypothetical protein
MPRCWKVSNKLQIALNLTAFGSSGVGVKPPELLPFVLPDTRSVVGDEQVVAIVTVNEDGTVRSVVL